MSHHISDNTGPLNTIFFSNAPNDCSRADEKLEILAWLSTLEPQRRHHDIKTRRVDKVGDWLLQTEEYRNWFVGDRGGSALFCHGGPGVGKTYISSLVIDTLCQQAVRERIAVACFYFDFAAPEEQSPVAILGSVLQQVVRGMEEVPEKIIKAFQDREKVVGGRKLPLTEIVEFLRDISSSRRTFICIDALDECPARHRVKLLHSLYQILQGSPGARILLTGRSHIRREVEAHLVGRVAARYIIPTRGDIITFLQAKLREDTIPDAMNESLEREIMQNIPETVSEIFLLVFLRIETILQETTIHRRRQKLRAVEHGPDLEDAYGATLGRMGAQGGERARLGMAVLTWISHSRRPLKVHEICHAIAIRVGSNDLDSDDIPAISTLLSCCQGLVTIDNGASTARVIHYTLQEYLCTLPDLFDRAHATIAETCLTYLNFQHVKDIPAGRSPDHRSTPFLEYSSLYWGTHMKIELSDLAKILALQLICQFGSHVSAKSLWRSINGGLPFGYSPGDKPFSALHCVSYFGITEVAIPLIKMNRLDVNQRDGAGMTPLTWAARRGNEGMVRLLLRKRRIQPDQQDTSYGRTGLSWAAGYGHEGVVSLFLGPRFVNPGSIGGRWGKGWRAVCQLFGRRYVNPDSSTRSGRTPLLWAAEHGHERVVKLLLGRKDVSSHTSETNDNRTPLSLAAENGHEGIVKLLLGREDVIPDSPSRYGRKPLLWAAENGHEGIVKLLLGRGDVNPDVPETVFGRTPLSWAVGNGHEGVVNLLLERADVNPDSSSKSGRTPFSWAAGNGQEGIVRLLLRREGVNPGRSSNSGRTPFLWAALNGHERIVELLLGLASVNPNSPEADYGRTPLSWAAGNGHEGVVELLLGRNNVNPDTPDTMYGRTPLSWAAGNGHEGIVRMLLGRRGVNPNRHSKSGQTPLMLASENRHNGVVELLRARTSRRSRQLGPCLVPRNL